MGPFFGADSAAGIAESERNAIGKAAIKLALSEVEGRARPPSRKDPVLVTQDQLICSLRHFGALLPFPQSRSTKLLQCAKNVLCFWPYGYSKEKCILPSRP